MFYPFSCYYKLNCFLNFIFSLFIVSASIQLILAYWPCILQPCWFSTWIPRPSNGEIIVLSLMGPGQLDGHMRKLDPYLTKWIKDLNIRAKTYKIHRRKYRGKYSWILGYDTTSMSNERKVNWTSTKLKPLALQWMSSRKCKDNPQNKEKTFANYRSKGFESRIYKDFLQRWIT